MRYLFAVIAIAALVGSVPLNAYSLISLNPTCGLWVWVTSLISVTSKCHVNEITICSAKSRLVTSILVDENHIVLNHTNWLCNSSFPTESNNMDISNILWEGSGWDIHVNISSVVNRKRLKLAQNFEFYIDGMRRDSWVVFRDGDDVAEIASLYILSHTPNISQYDYTRFHENVVNVYYQNVNKIRKQHQALINAVRESFEEYGQINVIVGALQEDITLVEGSKMSWLHFSVNALDVTSEGDFLDVTHNGQFLFDRITAEHVWEHLRLFV